MPPRRSSSRALAPLCAASLAVVACAAPRGAPRSATTSSSSAPPAAASASASASPAAAQPRPAVALAGFVGRAVDAIAVDAGSIYVVTRDARYVDEPGSFDVRRVPSSGGAAEVLADRLSPNGLQPPTIAAGDGALFFTGASNAITRRRAAGDQAPLAIVYGVSTMRVAAGALWVLGSLEPGGARALLAIPTGGGAPRTVLAGARDGALGETLAIEGDGAGGGEAFVWTLSPPATSSLRALPLSTSGRARTGPADVRPIGLESTAGRLFWWSDRDEALFEADARTLTAKRRAEKGQPLCAGGGRVLLADGLANVLHVLDPSEGRTAHLADSATACAVDGDDAYVTTLGPVTGTTLLRLPLGVVGHAR